MGFEPVDVGGLGRRAIAFFVRHGISCQATDTSVADHALSIVLEALQRTEQGTRHDVLSPLAAELLSMFPDAPGRYVERTVGTVTVNFAIEGVAYGYVRPSGLAHERGGALFDPTTATARRIVASPVYLLGDATEH